MGHNYLETKAAITVRATTKWAMAQWATTTWGRNCLGKTKAKIDARGPDPFFCQVFGARRRRTPRARSNREGRRRKKVASEKRVSGDDATFAYPRIGRASLGISPSACAEVFKKKRQRSTHCTSCTSSRRWRSVHVFGPPFF